MKQPVTSPVCRIEPGLEADPVALRLAALAEKFAPSAKVVITTSDAIGELPEGALLSAQNKLAKLGVDSPTVFQWVARHEQKVDWNKVKTEADLRGVVSARFAERAKIEPYLLKLDHQSDAAAKQVQALQRMAEHDPNAANTLQQYRANPAQHWGNLVGYVNSQRVKNVGEWQTYLTQGNEEYAADPYWQDLAWDIVDGALTSDRNHGLGTTIHLNQGILAELRQSINGKTQLVSLAANYGKLQVEFAKASAAEVVTTASKREWVYIPSKTEDPVNFQANVQKYKDLSCSTWCTKTFNAEPYLSQGGAWILTEGNHSIAQIRLIGETIREIQGVKNDNIIPPEAGSDIDDLLAVHPELKGVNLWRAKNPGTPTAVLRQLAAAPGGDDYKGVHCELAVRSDLDEETALILARHPFRGVREYLARNQGNVPGVTRVPRAALMELTKDVDPGVRRDLAHQVNLEAAAYEALAKDESAAVQAALLEGSSRRLTPAMLLKLAGSNYPETRKTLAGLWAVLRSSPEAVARLAVDPKHHVRLKLAKGRFLSDDAQLILAKDRTAAVRQAVAERPDAPEAALDLLAKSTEPETRLKVARNPGCTPLTLAGLAEDGSKSVRYAVAEHFRTTADVLATLAKDESEYIRQRVAEHSNAAPETLASLAKDETESVRETVANNRNTDPVTLATLAKDEKEYVKAAVAGNPNTSPEILAALAKEQGEASYIIRVTVAANRNTPPGALDALAQDEHDAIRRTVARNKTAPAEVLALLAEDPDDYIRQSVAKHPSTPKDALDRLFKYGPASANVREALAGNPNTPPETLREVAMWAARGDAIQTLEVAVRNPSIPTDILSDMSRHWSSDVRLAVVVNPAVPAEAIAALLEDEVGVVRRLACSNPTVSKARLEELAGSSDFHLRLGVCQNPNVTLALLERFARDEDTDVAGAAARKCSPAVQFAMLDDETFSYTAQSAAAAELAANPKTESSVLERVWDLGFRSAEFSFAANPNCPPRVLEVLSTNYDADVRANVARNKATPKELLKWLAADTYNHVCTAAIKNPNWIGKPEPVKEVESLPAAPVLEAAVKPEAAAAVDAPDPEKPKELVFDKKRKDQLVFNFSLSGEGVEAFYDPATDTTVFLQDKIASVQRAEALFFHETVGHRNVTLFAKTPEGKAELAAILNSAERHLMTELPELLKATGHKSLADLKKDYGFGDTEEGKTAVLGELLARHAEKLANTDAPTWWELLANKVEVWMAKHLGTRLGEDAITTWLARLPARLPAVEIELDRFVAPEGYSQRYEAPKPQAPTYHPPHSYGYSVN